MVDRLDQEKHPVRLVDRTPTQGETTTPPNRPSAVRYKETDWIRIKDDWLISWTETVVEPEYSLHLSLAHTMMATAILSLKNAVVLWTPPFAAKTHFWRQHLTTSTQWKLCHCRRSVNELLILPKHRYHQLMQHSCYPFSFSQLAMPATGTATMAPDPLWE